MAADNLIGVIEDGTNPSPNLPTSTRKTLTLSVGEAATYDLALFYRNGSPVDFAALTSPQVVFTVKKRSTDNPPLISHLAVFNPTAGRNRVLVTVLPQDTQRALPGRYVYDVWLVTGAPQAPCPLIGLSPFVLEPANYQQGQQAS